MTVLATRPPALLPTDAPCLPPPAQVAANEPWLIRPALRCDSGPLVAMHERCSPETRIARWHAPIRSIPATYLADVTGSVPTHAAVVAARTEFPYDLIGLASACLVSAEVWELGMLVEDAWQRRGVGRAMLAVLVEDVLRRGARELLAVSLEERRSVLGGLRALGPVTMSSESMTVTASVSLGH